MELGICDLKNQCDKCILNTSIFLNVTTMQYGECFCFIYCKKETKKKSSFASLEIFKKAVNLSLLCIKAY